MSSVTSTSDGNEVLIRVSSDFTFKIHKAFRENYKSHPAGSHFTVDLSGTEYMDSSGLGLLVQLKEYSTSSKRVTIRGYNDTIDQILKVANFDKMFDLKR